MRVDVWIPYTILMVDIKIMMSYTDSEIETDSNSLRIKKDEEESLQGRDYIKRRKLYELKMIVEEKITLVGLGIIVGCERYP